MFVRVSIYLRAEDEMKIADELNFGDTHLPAPESESRFNGKTPPATSAASSSSSSSAGGILPAASGSPLQAGCVHDGKRPRTKFGGKMVPGEVAGKQARAVQFAASGDTDNMSPAVLGAWADDALGGEDSHISKKLQVQLHLLKVVQNKGKNEDGEAARKRMMDVRKLIVSLLYVGERLGPLAPGGIAYRDESGGSVLRQIDVANDSITLNEVTTLPVSPDRVRCVPLTAFLSVSFLFLLITLLEEEEGGQEDRRGP